jgi:hypothetical protein
LVVGGGQGKTKLVWGKAEDYIFGEGEKAEIIFLH